MLGPLDAVAKCPRHIQMTRNRQFRKNRVGGGTLFRRKVELLESLYMGK